MGNIRNKDLVFEFTLKRMCNGKFKYYTGEGTYDKLPDKYNNLVSKKIKKIIDSMSDDFNHDEWTCSLDFEYNNGKLKCLGGMFCS